MISKLKNKYTSMPVQVRASLWFLVSNFMQKAVAFISTPIFTRLLTTEQYGEYNVYTSWMGILTVIITLNLSSGVFLQGLVKFDRDAKVYASSLQGLTLVLCTGWTVVYFLFHDFFNGLFGLTTVQMACMLVTIWTTAVFQFWTMEQRVANKYRLLVGLTVLALVAQPLIGVILVVLSDAAFKATARMLGVVIVNLAVYTWCFFVQMKRGKVFYSKRFWLYALKFNLPLVPHYLSQTLLYSCDRIMIGNFIGDDAVGIYSLTYSVANIMTMFNLALSQAMGPWIYRKIKEKRPQELTNVIYPAMLIVAAVNLAMIMLAPEAISIFAPPQYSDAKWAIPPIALSVFFIYLYDNFAAFQFYYEKTWFVMGASMAGAVLNIVLNYFFLSPRWFGFGYVAAGYTTLICYILYALMHYICMRWVCRKHLGGVRVYDPKVLLGLSVSLVTAGLLMTFTYDMPILRYSLVGVTVVLIIIFRHQLVAYVKKLMQLRRAGKEEQTVE